MTTKRKHAQTWLSCRRIAVIFLTSYTPIHHVWSVVVVVRVQTRAPKVVWSLRTYTKCGGDNNNNLDRTTLNNNINKNNYYNTIYGGDTQIRCESEFGIDSANISNACDDYIMCILTFYNTKECTRYAMRRPHSKTRQGKKIISSRTTRHTYAILYNYCYRFHTTPSDGSSFEKERSIYLLSELTQYYMILSVIRVKTIVCENWLDKNTAISAEWGHRIWYS